MARVLVPLCDGFEEVEAATVVDVLRRADVEVVLAGVHGTRPKGAHGLAFLADAALDAVNGDFDLVVLAGGFRNSVALRDDPRVQALLRGRVARGEPVAAICAAPLALDAAGALTEGRWTCYPGVEGQIAAKGRVDAPVVDAGAVITSQGPATAMAFALHLVGRLAGEARRAELARDLLVT